MKRIFLISLTIVFLIVSVMFFWSIVPLFASDTTNAQWQTKITIINTGAETSASVNFSLSTADMITAGMLNATATDCAILINGTDVYSMPGYSGAPWALYVADIEAASTKQAYLYSGNVTGGKIAWFPAAAGGDILDNNSLELGADFNIEFYACINNNSGGSYLIVKDSAALISTAGGNITARIYDGGWKSISSPIDNGFHKIELYASGGTMTLESDDIILGTVAAGAMSNNINDWHVGLVVGTPAMHCMEYLKIYVSGELRGYWYWEYAATFADHGVDATSCTLTPTFRTTSSDADVTVEVVSMESLVGGTTPTSSVAESAWEMISEIPDEPSGLYDEGGISFPWGAEIQAVEDDARLPHGTFLFPFAFGTAILAGVIAFKLSHVESRGIKGSLLIMCATIEFVLAAWYLIGGGVIPGWVLIPFGISSALLLLWRNPFSPVS